ncbi:Na(+)/H(+) antiporter subunit B [Parahaliea mediterranea]|uniref:Na(+)/H(+) antiporter subunit B n=1 Tax=Parahaliea mediterranea TaxID=651086 RepID=A0A939DFL9_9GAMM|nr:Na(+)/H(+) antiporter subunit B [Parahaliea mediterranea]MBN7797218.1 Na(+)/H(+) antiporter subunit B [Parahaliea mediterranea]
MPAFAPGTTAASGGCPCHTQTPRKPEAVIEILVNTVLLCLLVATAIALIAVRGLLASIMLTSVYGLLSASFFVTMDAVDVAFTEAAVGAGVSPLLLLLTVAIVGRREAASNARRLVVPLLLVTVTGALLIIGTLDMPSFGSPDAPAQTHVAPRYLQQSGDEIGIPNVVTSVLASYRAYDTLGEVLVIFTAGVAVLLALAPAGQGGSARAEPPAPEHLAPHTILQVVSKLLIPFMLLFAFYVQFHGEYGPGGGFQAGVIFASGIILYGLLYGLPTVCRVIPPPVVEVLAAVGALIYGLTGVLSLLAGKNFLDYSALAADPVTGQHIGIIAIELGVGIAVAAVIITIYYAFAGRLHTRED